LDTGGVNEQAIILFGIMLMTQDAATAGTATEIFTGDVDEDSWIWQGSVYVGSGAEAAVITDGLIASVEIDSKAMRRVKPGQALVFVHESPAELATDQTGIYDLAYFVHDLFGS